MKYIFTINEKQFATATRAYNYARSVDTLARITCNNEKLSLFDLLQFVELERKEKEHNKRQGL